MARSAARLSAGAAQKREFPQAEFAVRLFDAVDSHALTFMTSRAAEFIWRMSVVGQQSFAPRMSFERIRLLLKAGTIDCQMTGLTSVDPCNRLIEAIAVEFVEGDLLNFWTLVKRERADLESVVFHDADPLIPVGSHLGELVFEIFPARFYFFDFFPDLVPPCLRFFHLGVELCLLCVKLLDLFQIRRGISFFLD